jgi:hypothetical protein
MDGVPVTFESSWELMLGADVRVLIPDDVTPKEAVEVLRNIIECIEVAWIRKVNAQIFKDTNRGTWSKCRTVSRSLAGDATRTPPRSPAASSPRSNSSRTPPIYQAATEKQPDAVADVQPQAEKAPPPAEVIDVVEKAKHEADTPINQEDEMSKPWEAEGISRATWYRRHHETVATETVRQAGETETETGETVCEIAPETETTPIACEITPETVPETTQPAADATLYEMPADFSELQRRDAERYEEGGWGARATAYGWTQIQQIKLISQINGREVKQLTDTQALVGNKVFYRFQLHHT